VTPQDEAAQIFMRLFEALARRSGKTLNKRSRDEITRACELLASAGAELEDLFDELPLPRPRSEYTTINFEIPPEVDRWKAERGRS
jgi:hypothetical protein